MTATTLPDWADFERDYVATGVPHNFVVRAKPDVSLFVDQGGSRLGARFETSVANSEGREQFLAEIHVETVAIDGMQAIEIWTDTSRLYPNFYRLVCEIVAAVVDERVDPNAALQAAVSRWEALLSRPSLMSEEAQAGLFGELWLLGRLIQVHGHIALDSWVGPTRQPHDFRFGDIEVEVKTTTGNARLHTINGIGQLQPSLGCALYLLSVKLANSGSGGLSLPAAIGAIEGLLAGAPSAIAKFRRCLDALGYDDSTSHSYTRRWRLRDKSFLIPVEDGVPRITADALNALPATYSAGRIVRVLYTIDVEGMGFADGTNTFHAILPPNQPDVFGAL